MPRIFILILSFFVVNIALAQQDTTKNPLIEGVGSVEDSLVLRDSVLKETRKERKAREKAEKEKEKYFYKGIQKDSTRLAIEEVTRNAWRRSALVPGWGQITNGGKYVWVKLPVIYGGFVTAYLVFDYWNYYYKKFVDEAAYRTNNNGAINDIDLQGYESLESLIKYKDNFRRNRDMTVIVTAVWWAGNVIEAYTDSMLKNRYNIGDDLSFKISPTLMPSTTLAYQPNVMKYFTPGVKLTFNLK